MRPTQWVKNLIIFAVLVFSLNLFNAALLLRTLLAFFLFCILSGTVYIINDYADLENDRLHPTKCKRPLASGAVPPLFAIKSAILLSVIGLGGSFVLGVGFGLVALAYYTLVVSYTFYLKHVVILDVFAIALGFVLRALAGGVVIHNAISAWFLICILFLSLFLALSKRRHELLLLDNEASRHRRSLAEYSPYFLDQMIAIVTTSTVISYAMFTVSSESLEYQRFQTHNLIYTVPFVLYGVFRYLYLAYHKEQGGSPTRVLLTDRALMVDIFLWFIACSIILYRQFLIS
ncbi:MAG: decaprenyl-phosphate phosphoribosyltransferase [Candidatus Abyssobacteria bacterium SURF_5]|uniref:Decaprenyl-phosphate phosphoribosyltransferase n=1 Tax=Abyssobacteria bacterium (strain SURF_5) TaxID=2093360 RepID=A0A3A4NVG6_ABYX5|nr:MAG: decaprenyl-phosphate phosphoribosyltransferase [Candidatus Abyssubacteria bacterium SURF_5]